MGGGQVKEIDIQRAVTHAVMTEMVHENLATHRDNYFRVVSWWEMPYGRVPRGFLIGWSRNEDDKIYYETPRPPEKATDILYHNLPQSDQFFRRHDIPKIWNPDEQELRRIAMEKYSRGNTENQKKSEEYTNFNWWRVYSNMTPEMRAYFDREWDRRNNGVWFFNRGEATYLTGAHYTFLQHWWLQVGMYPIYKDRNLMDFYAWKAAEEDPLCFGLIIPKHRRSNHTTIGAFLGWEYSSRSIGGHFAIQSVGDTGAKKVFTDKVVPGWSKLVPFFRPISPTGTKPQTEIVMDTPSRTGKNKYFKFEGEDGNEGRIWYAPNGGGESEPIDGDAIDRYLRDEGGKEKALDINKQWGIVKHCLVTPNGTGKAYFPSTRETIKNPEYANKWSKLYRDSAKSIAIDSGTGETYSGLWSLFIPCYVGHEWIQFTGKHGESIIHKPTPEQREWLLENRCRTDGERKTWAEIYDKGGAYEYELRRRAANRQDPEEKRRMPFTPDEVFATVNPSCDFDTEMIDRAKAKLNEHMGKGTLFDQLTIRGNLEWAGGIKKGNVVFVPDAKGRFLWNRKYLPVDYKNGKIVNHTGKDAECWGGDVAERLRIYGNNVKRYPPRQGYGEVHGTVRPKKNIQGLNDGEIFPPNEVSWIKIGMDPAKIAASDQRAKRRSKASSAGFYPYRQDVDGEWPSEPEANRWFAEDWETEAWIFHYSNHQKNANEHHEDMLKAAIFLNAEILYERQLDAFTSYMRAMGCVSFLITDQKYSKDKKKSVPGLPSSKQVIDEYFLRLQSWIKYHCYAEKCPFPDILEQWTQADPGDMERFDEVVSTGYALYGAYPEPLRVDEKFGNLQPEPVAVFDMATCYPKSRRNVNGRHQR